MINTEDNFYRITNLLEGANLIRKVQEIKADKKILGLCSGSFDLLHPGHITHLSSAKKFCDVLMVAIARDKRSEQLKSRKGRPIFSEQVRAYCISQLRFVDYVVYNEEEYKTIDIIKPNFYIKGKDYIGKIDPEMDRIKDFLKERGGKIVYTTDEKLSTT